MRLSDGQFAVLADVATFASGRTPPRSRQSDYFDGGIIPWVKTLDLNNGAITRTDESVTPRALADAGMTALPPGTVLVAMYGGFNQIGRTGVLRVDAVTNQAITAIRPDPRKLDSDYLLHLLNFNIGYWRTVASSSRKDPNITKDDVRQFPVSLPPISIQKRIADSLNDAESMIATLEHLIAKKQAIKQGMMQQLLTGRIRLPGFSSPWKPRRLGDLLTYEQPGRYLVSSADYSDSGIPVLTAGKTFLLGYTTEKNGVFDAVPVIIFDDFTTASKFVDFPFKAKSSAMKMLSARPGVDLRYLYERMQLIEFVAVDHKRRWIAEYSKIEIDVPDQQEQEAIATILDVAQLEIKRLQQRLTKAQVIKTGMMQQLLTGRIRLPVEVSS